MTSKGNRRRDVTAIMMSSVRQRREEVRGGAQQPVEAPAAGTLTMWSGERIRNSD